MSGTRRHGQLLLSLETECIARKPIAREISKSRVFDYIERFYNPTRGHLTFEYPIDFERRVNAA